MFYFQRGETMRTKIFVATGSPMENFNHKDYYPILVGEHDHEFLDSPILRDTVGDSLAHKNPHYCELTALYWAWKNDVDNFDYIGLCHYRRFFAFDGGGPRLFPKEGLPASVIDAEAVPAILSHYDIILPTVAAMHETIYENYARHHRIEDLHAVLAIMDEKFPEYHISARHALGLTSGYYYNMFITRKEIFVEYMNWLFTILFELEKRIQIPDDPYQARIFGFLAERMFNIFIMHKQLRVKTLPIVFTEK